MRGIDKALYMAAVIAFGAITESHAELAVIDHIGQWELMKDTDPLFGPLGYQLALGSATDDGSSTLTLQCYFDEKDTITYGIELSSTLVDFHKLGGSTEFTSLLRYDDEDIRQADWLKTKEPSRVGFSSGGNNFVNDQDNPLFKEAVRQAQAGEGGSLQRVLTTNMLASGIEMFFWNMTERNELALGFGSGDTRTSMLFDLSGGEAAVERLLGDCHRDAEALQPQDTRSPREIAEWGALETTNTEYKTINLDVGQCLELHAVRHRRGDPLTVDELIGPGEYERMTAESGDIVIEGPKERLRVYFGDNASAGRFDYRTWDRRSATCDED